MLMLGKTHRTSTDYGRMLMKHLSGTQDMLAGLCALLLVITGGLVVTAQAASTANALTAEQVSTCVQTAVASQAGMVTKVEVEHTKGQRLCEVSIIDTKGKKHTLQVDVSANQVVKTK
jgi:hypothetical protein